MLADSLPTENDVISPRQLIASIFQVRRDRHLRAAFQALFGEEGKPNDDQATALAFLREFCNVHDLAIETNKEHWPVRPIDPLAMAFLEGRRSVWRAINFYMNIDEGELVDYDRQFARDKQSWARQAQEAG